MRLARRLAIMKNCVICDRQGHSIVGFPTLPTFKEVLQNGVQISVNALNQLQKSFNNAFSNTYNPGWWNRPIFSWRNTEHTNFGSPGQDSGPSLPQANPIGLGPYGYQNQGQVNGPQGHYQNPNPNVY